MSLLRRILRDPLVHFLAGGALIFAVSALIHPGSWQAGADERTIVVDRAALLKYMQYQSAAFRPDYFEAQLAAMSPRQRQALVDNVVREEAMVREARAMGLDSVDYVIRQRLMQKVLFLVDDTAGAAGPPGDAELRRYYEAHRDTYRAAPTLSFTHAFIDNEIAHPEGGEKAAQRLKAQMEAAHAGFDEAPGYGDRIPFLQNYVDRGQDFVANQFGKGFADAVGALAPSPHWQGPIRSDYGWHVVLLTAKNPARTAPFEDVRAQVRDDLLAERTARFRDKALKDLVRQYDVRIEGIDVGGVRK
jgi:hypothetical protein